MNLVEMVQLSGMTENFDNIVKHFVKFMGVKYNKGICTATHGTPYVTLVVGEVQNSFKFETIC